MTAEYMQSDLPDLASKLRKQLAVVFVTANLIRLQCVHLKALSSKLERL